MNNIKTEFLDFFMNKLKIKVKNMENFIGCSKKTVYNYRQMSYSKLPVEVWEKIFNFITFYIAEDKVESFEEIYKIIDNLTEEEIVIAKIKFEEVSELRLLEKKERIKRKKEYQDSLALSMSKMEQYYAEKNKKSTKYIESDDNTKNIYIEDTSITALYITLLERELNKAFIGEDFNFISHIREYRNKQNS